MEITWKRNFYFFFLLLVFKMNMCLSRTNEDDWQIIVDRWKDSGWIDGWIGGWTDNRWTEGQMGRQTDEWINHPLSLSFTLSLFLSLGSPPTLPQTLPPLSTTSSIFFHPFCQTHTNICQYDYICEGFFFIIHSPQMRSHYICFSCFSHLTLYSAHPSGTIVRDLTHCLH